MKITKKLEKEIRTVIEDYWGSYLKGDLQTWASYLSDDYQNIGTTQAEIWNSKKEIVNYTEMILDQIAGMAETRNKKIHIIPYGPYFMVHELGDLYIKAEEGWVFYAPFRLSSLLEKTAGGWKVLHQHGSYPDSKTEEGEAFAFSELKVENKKLRDAIKSRTIELEQKNRELEIETALERVRAVAMSMNTPKDLQAVGEVIFKELKGLGFSNLRNTEIIINQDEKQSILSYYYSDYGVSGETEVDYTAHPVLKKWAEDLKTAGDGFASVHISESEMEGWKQYRETLGQLPDPKLDQVKTLDYYSYSTGSGALAISSFTPISSEQLTTLERFRNVFGLAYRRYMDVVQAQTQAREAQVEAALERVRARTMAMHNSEELLETGELLFKELSKLDIKIFNCGYVLIDGKAKMGWNYGVNPGDGTIRPLPTGIPQTGTKVLDAITESWRKREPFLIIELDPQETIDHQTYMAENLSNFSLTKEQLLALTPERLVIHTFNFKHGYLLLVDGAKLATDQQEMLMRFASVFEMTYRRFLDLQKAEAQAREAQIEAALERVRSASLAMHHTSELQQVINAVHQQLSSLNIPITGGAFIVINEENKKEMVIWGAGGSADTVARVQIPFLNKPIYTELIKLIQKGPGFYTEEFSYEEKIEFFKHLFKHPPYSQARSERKKELMSRPGGYTRSCAASKNTSVVIINHHGRKFTKDENEILQRIARVFEQSYTRFLDLQKAEAQARDAKIEAALERVRAKTMAMHNSEDVGQCILKLFGELIHLGVPESTRLGIAIFNHDNENVDLLTASKDENEAVKLYSGNIDTSAHPLLQSARNSWKEKKEVNQFILEGKKEVLAYYQVINAFPDYQPKIKTDQVPDKVIHYDFVFDQGLIYAFCNAPLTDELIEVFCRFSALFKQTYRRYLDLVKAEAQAREAKIEAALERVRSRSLAVNKVEEFNDVVGVVFEKLSELDIPANTVTIMIYKGNTQDYDVFGSAVGETGLMTVKFELPHFNTPMMDDIRQVRSTSEEGYYSKVYSYEEKNHYYEFAFKNTELKNLPDDLKQQVWQSKAYAISAAYAKNSMIGVNDFEGNVLGADQANIIKRFSRVFEQAYIRFLDLQRAEAQAREAQIEAALERVRSRSMAMHQSTEIQEVANTVFDNLLNLGVSADTVTILIPVPDTQDFEIWIQNTDRNYTTQVLMPYQDHIISKDFIAAWRNKCEIFSANYTKEKKDSFFQFFFERPESLAKLPDERKRYVFNGEAYAISVSFNEHTGMYIGRYTNEAFSEADNNILKRFAKVFEQSYTRFLDLQRAEAQAREAQIEASLERVRARTMAMHHSEELAEATNKLYQELATLGIKPYRCNIAFVDEESHTVEFWSTTHEGKVIPTSSCFPINGHSYLKTMYAAWKQQSRISLKIEGKNRREWTRYIMQYVDFEEYRGQNIDLNIIETEPAVFTAFPFRQGYFFIHTITELDNADQDIIARFAKVFEQTYTRFLDLQKVEAQAREAQIEAALERVRAQTMAMHNSEDVGKCVVKMFGELTALGVDEGTRFGIGILNHDNENNQLWTATKDGEEVKMHIGNLDMNLHPLLKSARKAWQEQVPLHKYFLEGEDLLNYYQMLNDAPDYKYRIAIEKLPEREIHYGFIFDHGFFYAFNSREFQHDIIQIIQRFSSLFGQTYRRYLDLVKAEAQTREAQIEAAVERVRAQAMAMHSSKDFSHVNEVLWEQVNKLEVTGFAGAGIALFDQNDHITWWDFSSAGNIGQHEHKVTRYNYKKYTLLGQEIWDAYQKGEPYYILEYDLPRLKKAAKEWAAINPIIAADFEKAIASGHLTYQWGACARITNGFLTFDHLQQPDEDAKNILVKMAGAFELAYQRFLDLQKAEAQAREAQIEAALERTRTQSMLMQHSNELNKVSHVFHEQLLLLGLPSEFSYVWLPDEESMTHMFWATWSENLPAGEAGSKEKVSSRSKAITYPLDKSEPYTAACYEMWESDRSVFVNRILPEEVGDFFSSWQELVSEAENMKADLFPDGLYYAEAYMKYGCFGINIRRPLSKEEQQVLYRFSIEFERAYTRFLDLKKAEVRAREAQIEAALEIVRSRTMAMHKAEELHDVVSVVVEKLVDLGVALDANGVILVTYFPNSRDVLHWIASPDFSFSGSYLLPYFDHPIFSAAWESKLSGTEYFSQSFTVEEKNSFFEYAFEHSDYRHFPEDFKQWVFQNDKHSLSFAWSKNSAILIPSHTGVVPTDEDAEILKRFAKVFEQAYVRFMDLQKAEMQAKEAMKRAALDRVRGEIASMRSTGDLNRITPVIWRELTSLDVPFIRCGVFIIDEESEAVEVYLTTPDGSALGVLHLPFGVNSQTINTVKYWKEKKVYREHWDAQTFIDWTQSMIEMGQVKNFADYKGSTQIPDELHLHFVPFKQGMLYVGDIHPLPDEKIELVKTLAEAFAIAYARYEDFTKLEQAKSEVEAALAELKATQAQLIQSEKMASLGELTAGIAHEIQNPLNFVNNFSEVTHELIEDMRAEIENGDLEEAKAIANDIQKNLEKINHHGGRADAIVKGMLQHSRQNTAEKSATDINKLADEYLRLAYHGLRAKDKSFNATLNTDFDPSLEKLLVIPQDIGRVILNLVTNAFYAVHEKKRSNGTDFQPAVAIGTKKTADHVIITVKDNGNGIPKQVLEKIFQPFFTTKPTGQGTGLGLSLSYDIIKAHKGKLEVETKEGAYTLFKIILPNQQN